ncbi:MAG: methionyl-tRNA formyltransferase [Smithellaceae bacterium]|nr:methionyl-tRNA formyltransferase [Syntrophaceae bacterium]MDD4241002.1 methionyl-tRNA formyltransferase [Smithellaceae bacterium]
MNPPRILFMGTPEFALPALAALSRSAYPVCAVVTQPDRPAGRGQKEAAPPVKTLALSLGLPVLQPVRIKDSAFLETLRALAPDMIVVAAFGQLLPKALLDFPPCGCLNIHPSLLPKYRGAAPLHWSIIRGETTTGVTVMLMDEGMDSGDILLQEETPLGPAETFGELHDRLARMGAGLLIATIEQVMSGAVRRQKQDASLVTFAPRLTRETGKIAWNNRVADIVNLIRGLSPAPAAYTALDGQTLKIFTAEGRPGAVCEPPGFVGAPADGGLPVAAADGHVLLKDVQLAGKKRMPIGVFLRGYRLKENSVLG